MDFDKEIEKNEEQLLRLQEGNREVGFEVQHDNLVKKLEGLHKDKESFWFMRSRAAEIKDGDRNTSYFHHKA